MAGSIDIDVSKKLKSYSFNTKDKTAINIKGLANYFIEDIKNVVASGNTLSVYIDGVKKPLKFTNITNPNEIDLVATSLTGAELYNKKVRDFYAEEKFVNQRKWLSKASSTKAVGSVFDEVIDLSEEYVPTSKNAKKKIGVTVNTSAGDDTVVGTGYSDKIVIDGAGDKTIKIKKGDGDDTIVFKGEGLKAKVTIDFDYDEASLKAEYSYRKEGNDLYIDRIWNGDVEHPQTTTIKDYFKHNLNIFISKDSSLDVDTLIDEISILTVNGNPYKASTIVGTDFDDSINGGLKVDKITTGGGDDIVFALLGNDKITINGKGNKSIKIGRADGNDSILFDLDKVEVTEKINVNIDLYSMPAQTKYEVAKNKQDLLIINEYAKDATSKALTQTITVKNYFDNVNKINLTVGDDNVYDAIKEESEEIATDTRGTIFDDVMYGTDGADLIYAYAGNDTIYASKGNDKIDGGSGDDTYIYTNFAEIREDGNYYHDTIYNSSGDDRISFTDLKSNSAFFQTQPQLQGIGLFPGFQNQYGCTYIKNGNDLVIGGFESYDAYDKNYPMNRITLKDYFKSTKGEYGVKYIDNGIGNADYASINLADDMMIEHSWRTISALSDHKANKYTGTAYNDYIEGSYKQDTLKGGDGNDIVNGFNCVKGKDYLYGGAGNDIMCGNDAYMYGGTGNDTYMSASIDTFEGVNTVISDESGYDTVALPVGQYMIYFDVTQKDGKVTSTGDMYIKDVTAAYIPMEHDLGNRTAVKIEDHNELVKIFKSNEGAVIKNGTTTGIIEHYDIGSYDSGQKMRYSASYNQNKVDEIANSVAQELKNMGYSSVSEAIKKCNDTNKLYTLVSKFDNVLSWENTYHSYWITGNVYNNYPSWLSDYTTEEFRANYHGTLYADEGMVADSSYVFSLSHSARYSVINDYGGVDSLTLDNDKYSFLFDVEIDDKGSLLNYSRDFYVKFAGEEANETGVVIHDGRQEMHAVERIYIGENQIFQYNQATIESVRQNVAGWLTNNNYCSVQDVLYSGDAADINSMMKEFAPINNYQPEA